MNLINIINNSCIAFFLHSSSELMNLVLVLFCLVRGESTCLDLFSCAPREKTVSSNKATAEVARLRLLLNFVDCGKSVILLHRTEREIALKLPFFLKLLAELAKNVSFATASC